VTETRPDFFALFCFSSRAIFLSTHLADLLFADRRCRDGFATGIAAGSKKATRRAAFFVGDIQFGR
jgi:hypothetical protein